MRVKIELEMSGNAFLDLLRRVPKTVAEELKKSVVAVPGTHNNDEADLLWSSATQLIEAKKR